VIKEIAWRWREIGADGRICDLMDSQVSAIEAACEQISSAGAGDGLSAAFDLIEQRIAGFGGGDRTAAPAAAEASPSPPPSTPASSVEMPAAVAETVQAATATQDTEAAIGTAAMPAEEIVAAVDALDMAAAVAEAAEVAAEVAEITADACDAHDEALLDLVAFEMSAPEPSAIDDVAEANADEIAELPPAEPAMVAPEPEPIAAAPQPLAIQPSLQPALERSPEPSHEPSHSLGSSLIASGIVPGPHFAASDPLAPIRRLSQAEKIALFS
jgi:DNA polymerase III gamma/tau subunit